MKKNLFSFMAFIILILGSCQESTYVEDIQEYSTNVKLANAVNNVDNGIVARLQAYNDSLCCNQENIYSNNHPTSKPWVKVALADAFGFCEGAAVGMTITAAGGPLTASIGGLISGTCFGAYRSWQASNSATQVTSTQYKKCISSYIKMKEDHTQPSLFYPKIISLNLPTSKVNLQESGAMHNIVLDNIQNGNFSHYSPSEAFAKGLLSKHEFQLLNNSSFKARFINSMNEQPSFDLGEKPNAIIELYHQAIQNSAISYTDVESISNRYINEIYSTSELAAEQKDNVTKSICVLVSSVEYWKAFDAPQQQN